MVTRRFTVLNDHPGEFQRTIEVEATEVQLKHLEVEGYLVREQLIPDDLLARLRAAADEIESRHLPTANIRSRAFGGLFVRNILDEHEAFHELLDFAPLISVARAMLGPQVQVHGNVLRVSYPDQDEQAVEWHFHQRVIPEPMPPFFCRPAALDNLIYLDPLTPESGPIVVLPRTHQVDRDLPSGDHADKPGQVVVTCPAGSVVTASASLWHRALAPKPGAGKRRLVIVGYSPTWMKPIDRLSAGADRGLTDRLVNNASEEKRELLGLSGFF